MLGQHQLRLRAMRRRLADEKGMSLIFAGVGFMAFFAATTLAIDVGQFMAARSQAQSAADAAALAGATAFVYESFDDRTAGGPAVQSAINTAKRNKVLGGDVSIDPADVTFPIGSGGQYDRVQVWVRRLNVPTLIGNLFNVSAFDAKVSAAAWKTKPSWYVVSKLDEAIAPDEERFFAKRMKATTTELNTSHVAMLSQPKAVVAVIMDAAGKATVASAGRAH